MALHESRKLITQLFPKKNQKTEKAISPMQTKGWRNVNWKNKFSFSLVFLRDCARVFIFSNIATLNVTIQKWRFQILCFYFFFQKFFTKKVSTKFSNQTDEKLFFKVNLPLHFNSFSFRFHSVKNTNFEWFVLFYLN